MNKQEVIEKIEHTDTLTIVDYTERHEVAMVNKYEVLDIISQIDEPQKVVVPKYVAEWIKSQKESFSDVSAIDMYDNLTLDNNGGHYHDVWLWVIDHHYDFIKAWHNGYTVEQEKLYTVEIPNPNKIGNERNVLMKNGFNQIVMLRVYDYDDNWRNNEAYQLTEAEIKKDFDWAWQWKKEVKE